MNPFKAVKEKIEMDLITKLLAHVIERSFKNYITTIIGVIVVALTAVNQFGHLIPAADQTYVTFGVAILGGLALTLAKDAGLPAPKLPTNAPALFIAIALSLGLLALPVHAQSSSAASAAQAEATAAQAPVQNFYAGGVSYSVGGSPAIAGTGLYAHLLANTGTYAFTAVDALPNTVKPFTVSTNIGVGIAQKVFTLGNVPVYVPTAAGISWSGSNTGWQWNGGAMAAISLKGNYFIAPSVRFLKSSVSGGTGYQPIIGILFGWGR